MMIQVEVEVGGREQELVEVGNWSFKWLGTNPQNRILALTLPINFIPPDIRRS